MNAQARFPTRPILLFFGTLLIASSSLSQSASSTMIMSIAAASFTPENSLETYDTDVLSQARFATGAAISFPAVLVGSFSLPNGAVLDELTFDVYDNDPSYNVEVHIHNCLSGGPCLLPDILQTTGQPGWTTLTTGPYGGVSDNANSFYLLRVLLDPGTGPGLTMFQRAVAYYHPQVSPAPATATFNDVPTDNPYFQFVEAIAAAGITAGCGAGNYCPDAAVTRGQMAVFLAKALGIYWPPVSAN